MAQAIPRIGVIGGSGLYEIPGAKVMDRVTVDTPWGLPSDEITLTEISDQVVAFLPRHGRGHGILPTEVNSRANLCALKSLGVEQVVSFSAVGSLKEELAPLDFVVPTQIIDRTRSRPSTYFGEGIVGHVAFADPFCGRLSATFVEAIRQRQLPGGQTDETIVCMEGPLFSTRAESELYRSYGAGLINMSVLPEAKLAREAELCYALIAMVTDYDCWREGEDDVDIQSVLSNLSKNAEHARELLQDLITRLGGDERACGCGSACQFAIITAEDRRPPATVEKLRAVLPKYF